jgi:hypothetical protein
MELLLLGLLVLGAGAVVSACSGRFHYKQKYGSWRAYFNSKPGSMSHVLHDSDGYYVCWDRPLRSENEARHVANSWIQRYG